MNRYIRKSIRAILWVIASIVLLIVLALIAIQIPYVQNLGKDKVVRFLEDKLKTKVAIRDLSIDWPKRLVLEDVYFEDQTGDTLLSGDTIKVDLYMLKLLSNQVVINEIDLRGITGFIDRNLVDSTFNFDYIIKAFVREEKRDVPLDSAAAMRFSVSKINLERIKLRMNDEVTGTDVAVYLKHFDTEIKDFDLDNKKFRIPKIKLAGLNATLIQTKALSRESVTTDTFNMSAPRTYPDLVLGEIDISDIHIDYDNTITAIDSKLDLGELFIEFDTLDLPNQEIGVRTINLDNTSGRFALGKTAQEAVVARAEEVAELMEKGWTVNLSKLGLNSIDFKFDDLTKNKIPRGIDYSHIDLKDLIAEATDILYTTDTLSGKINQLTLTESSGLDLKNFNGEFFYGFTEARLDNFVLETPKSYITDQVHLTYPSLDAISEDIGKLGISAHFTDSRLAVSDLLLFAPSLAKQDPFRNNQNAIILIDGSVTGRIGDLRFTGLELTGLGNIRLRGSGRIAGLPDVSKSYFDLNIGHFSASGNDLRGLIPASSLPSNFRLPEYVAMQGTFIGTFKNFSTNMNINSSFGTAHVNGTLKNISNKQNAAYNMKIRTNQFDVGRLLSREDKIGKISLNANIQGTGMDPKTANAKFDGQIDDVFYNGYTYHNIKLSGTANNGDIEVDGSILDLNITLDLHAVANMNGEYPKLDLTMNLDSINMQKLNFYEKDLRIHGQIVADLETADPDYLNGTINVADLILYLDGKRYKLDTISILSVATPGVDSLELKSEFLTMNMKGQYNLTDVFPALRGTINKYFNISPAVDPPVTYEPQQIAFTATLMRSALIEELMPDLERMEDANLSGNFDSNTGEIKIEGSIPSLQYKEYTVNELNLDIHTENDALNYAVTLDQLTSKQFQIANTSLSGKAQNDILDIKLLVKDAEEKDQYQIAGEFKSANKLFEFSLLPNGLVLNYEPWTVAPDNVIQFGQAGVMARNFKISNGGQSMLVNSNPQQLNAPLDIQFSDFQIETLTRLITKDSLFAGGTMNGLATVRDFKTNLVFTSDLTITDFSFYGDTVGNIAMKVNNEKLNTYAADVQITGYGNEVNMNGYYYVSGDQSNYDLKVDIIKLNMKSIEGFTMGQIDGSSGSINGDLAIKGTFAQPTILGEVHFQEAGFMITKFNSHYLARDETIRFTSEGIVLNHFTLLDTFGNEAVLNGNVFTKDYRDYGFGLTLHADNFQVLNSTRYNNKIYYGPLFIDTDMRIGGGFGSPVIDGNIRVNDKTILTIVVPQTDPGIVEREGIVEFIDMDTFQYTILTAVDDSLTQADWTGMDVAVNITIDKEAELNLIIDEANGDYLNIKGEANLTGGVDPSGKVTLTGLYELDQGSYSFHFNQLKREFKIRKGSSILWTGEPLTADVNVTAVYTAETAPLSLVQNQLGEAEQNVINTYKQKLPFNILLTMKGELLKPVITFDIELPEDNHGVSAEVTSTVQTRLAQLRLEPSELNKQVFAVLLLNRFISEDPFQNDARGGGISSMARQSASKLLSEQLNNMVGGIIEGFDLTFDINSIEDYTSGELQNRTDLTVGLSKRLLDDRLTVSVGSNFELEGPQETDRKTTNIAGDVSAEYQLSKDGRYLLRVYRKDEYIIVQGQVVETGIGFIFTADYENFKDIFAKKTEEEKLWKKEAKETRKEERNEIK